jgi:putative ABC transport system permease protein
MGLERWINTVPLRLRSLFRRKHVERELNEELHDHLERQVEANLALGMSAGEARRKARLAMGGIEQRKEECRDTRRVSLFENFWRDARYALSSLRRNKGFTAVAVLTLGLGIGANTAIFTVVNSVLLRPLPYRDPGKLVLLKYEHSTTVAPGTFFDWQGITRAFASMGLAEWWSPNLTGSDRPERLRALHISSSILPMMGVAPMLGRVFAPEEEHEGRDRVAVLSYPYWKARFDADRGVVGHTMILDGESYTIVGVMPEGFDFAPFWATRTQIWAPLNLDPRKEDRDGSSLRAFARLNNGVSLAGARSDVAATTARVELAHPGTSKGVVVVPLQEIVVGNVHDSLVILLAAVAFVMLIACANVAHLQLMRAAAREREFAVRTALGASRSRILQQSFMESGILAAAGAALGLALAWGGVRLLVALGPSQLPRLETIGMDGTVFGFLVVSIVFAALLFGAAPALAAARADVQGALKEGSRGASESGKRGRFRGILVASEFAMAVVLLVGAGLVLRSFFALLAVDPGFDPRNLVSAQVSVEGTSYNDPLRRAPFFQDLVERVRSLPGIESASAINHLPLNGDNWTFPFSVEGRPIPMKGKGAKALFRVVKPGYFRTMRIPVLEGRDLSPADEAGAAHVVVVNQLMAKRHWPGKSAIGERISVDDPVTHPEWFTIVGVVKDARQSAWAEPSMEEMYYPYEPDTLPKTTDGSHLLVSLLAPEYLTLVVRTASDPVAVTKSIESVVHDLDRNAPVSNVITLEQVVAGQFAGPRFYLLLLAVFAGVAVLLAAIGVYGVISYSVARRTREIGVRLALGAHRGKVFGLIVRQGMRLALIGGVIGLAGALLITRFLRTLLFGVQPTDPATFVLGTVILAVVALVACAIPARRAAGVDPATVLRGE